VCAVDKRIKIDLIEAPQTNYSHDFFPKIEEKVKHFLEREKETYSDKSYTYSISSDIPIGRGMGSSAALSAASSAALLELYTGKEWSLPLINQCAYEVEKIFHHNPSGVDVSASVFGGLIWFRKEFEFLKSISSLTMNIPRTIIDSLFLIDTGKPQETTADMVRLVGSRYNQNPSRIEKILSEIERATKRVVISIAKEDSGLFAEAVKINEELLESLGVVSKKAKDLLSTLRHCGVGKVTGAGGKKDSSGFILFYAQDKDIFIQEAKKHTLTVMRFIPVYKGITREE
jgi:mevalonate kinase